MDFGIGGLTSSAIGLALDGLSMRHDAIASNIANLNTAGYRPVKVSFEEQLANFVSAQKGASTQYAGSLAPQLSFSASDTSNSATRLDMNTVLLNQNTLQYQALISGLDKYMSNIALATNDGRR